jgi:hypothetical protein
VSNSLILLGLTAVIALRSAPLRGVGWGNGRAHLSCLCCLQTVRFLSIRTVGCKPRRLAATGSERVSPEAQAENALVPDEPALRQAPSRVRLVYACKDTFRNMPNAALAIYVCMVYLTALRAAPTTRH